MSTKVKWHSETDWRKLRPRLGETDTERTRKLRLFGVACCCRVAHLFDDHRTTAALEVNERFADGRATEGELAAAAVEVLEAIREEVTLHGASAVAWARDAVWRMSNPGWVAAGVESCLKAVRDKAERAAQTVLFREVHANPIRPVACAPSWLTSNVLALAAGIYEDKAFDRLPILADALQDAGCGSAPLLAHCRDEQAPHVRGCWAVDLLLGKT